MTVVRLAVVRPDTLLERIAELSGGRRWLVLSSLAAVALHAGLTVAIARTPIERARPSPTPPAVFELEPVTSPTSVPEPPQEPEPPLPVSQRPAAASRAEPAKARAAQAAPVLTQAEHVEQPVDFTDAIVTGNAVSFAGGMTASTGTSTTAVRAAASSRASGHGSSAADTGTGDSIDRSRAPAMTGGLDWKCPFPPEADRDGVDRAVATIRAELDASGRTTRVAILNDPGHGFGQAARRCALAKRWTSALDRAGNPVAASVTVAVRFVR